MTMTHETMETPTRNWLSLVSDEIVEQKYIPISSLKYIDHSDQWERVVIDHPLLNLSADDGVIVVLTGTARRDLKEMGYVEVALDEYGREISPRDILRMPPRMQAGIQKFKVWDFRVTKVTVTDGPARKADLMESYEASKRRKLLDEQGMRATEMSLAAAVSKLADRLEAIPGPDVKGKVGK